jgi:hypothetical protein
MPCIHYRYRESKMLSVYVNLFAAISYVRFNLLSVKKYFMLRIVGWQVARVASHANGNVGNIAQVHNYRYFDYVFTCPLLVCHCVLLPDASSLMY